MLKVKLAYTNNNIDVKDQILQIFPELEYFNEDNFKERKRAFSIKNIGCTKLSPFLVVYNNDKVIKAFWQEDNTFTIENIKEWASSMKIDTL